MAISGEEQRLLGYTSLSQKTNQTSEKTEGEGTIEILNLDVYGFSEMSDDELLRLINIRKKAWMEYYANLEKRQKKCLSAWLGTSKEEQNLENILNNESEMPKEDNVLFEALEVFLPLATRQNPEPIVSAGTGIEIEKEATEIADNVARMLQYHADVLRLKLDLKTVVRQWAMSFLGCIKVGFINNDINLQCVKFDDLILDSKMIIRKGEYTGSFIGEIKRTTIRGLIEKFPSKKNEIMAASGMNNDKINFNKEIVFEEWWTERTLYWTLGNKTVLAREKNPHWNEDRIEEDSIVNKIGQEIKTKATIKGINHFSNPKMPYIFLSVFNLENHPHDDTSLIEQNISNQKKIDRRNKQIDRNVTDMNGGWVVSMEQTRLDKAQAARLAEEIKNGGVAVVPQGDARAAVAKIIGGSLPVDVYNERQDARNELRNIFGVTGLSPQGTMREQTVRGKIIIRGQDGDRVSGGVSEYLEQFVDLIYNWFVQLYYVYYDEDHFGLVLGKNKTIILNKKKLEKVKLLVSVKEGSLLPKDNLSRRNEAIDLFTAGVLDPISLYEKLEFPNPMETAKRLFEWKNNPQAYLGEVNSAGVSAGIPQGISQSADSVNPNVIPSPETGMSNVSRNDIINQIPLENV